MRYRLIFAAAGVIALLVFFDQGLLMADETPIGDITETKGSVTIVKEEGREICAERGSVLYPGDQITTGKGGMVWFSFHNGDRFRLTEEAHVCLDELSSPEMDDHRPVMRLILGYLWSKIGVLRTASSQTAVHTPTAVVGIRGTEFDTVVSLDGTSAIAVDEGAVDVETQEQKTVVDKGRMLEVEIDGKAVLPVAAVAKEKRNWREWRRQRIQRLFENLPEKAPKFRRRFERGVNRFSRFTARVRENSRRVSATIEKIRQARIHKDRQKALQLVQVLKKDVQRFKNKAAKFRKALNRVRVMGRFSRRVEMFTDDNRSSFSKRDYASIQSHLTAISAERDRLKATARETIKSIRGTFKDLRQLRDEIRRRKSTAA